MTPKIRDETLARVPGAQAELEALDHSIFVLIQAGANPQLLQEWLTDTVYLMDSATLPPGPPAANI